MPQLAGWLVDIRDNFADVAEVCESEPYKLVVRLIDDHLDIRSTGEGGGGPGTPEDGGERIKVRTPYKGSGYEVQLVEFCNNEGTELILDFDVHRSGILDHGKAAEARDRLAAAGVVPESVFFAMGRSRTGQAIPLERRTPRPNRRGCERACPPCRPASPPRARPSARFSTTESAAR